MFMLSPIEVNLAWWLIKGFAFVGSLIFLLYSIVLLGQVRSLNRTVTTDLGQLVVVGSVIQLIFASIIMVIVVLLVV